MRRHQYQHQALVLLLPNVGPCQTLAMHSIYLYKPPETESITNTWIYYRIASVDAVEPGGTLFATIQVCKVTWPTFEDIPPVIDTPGITGLESAWEHQCAVLKRMGVDHEQSVLIGFLQQP